MSAELKSLFGALPRTARGQPIVVNGKDKNFLYTHSNSVFIRNIENPATCDVYTEHSQPTTVAKYSPSGFYIASADTAGKVRIWDTVNVEHVLKNEFQPFAGPIKDLDWSSDNQRIVVGGQGRETFSHVFSADTGTSVGDMMGHSKAVNSVTFKPSRPFRIATGSEDQQICFYQGPPFKFSLSIEEHKNFVNCVRYSPSGDFFVSGGADGKALLFDGKDGKMVGEFGAPAHKGGIYGVAFSPNNSEVLTVSGDKSAKIWNVASRAIVVEFILGTTVNDMQVGCLWQGDHIITVSLSGWIIYLDRNNPAKPHRIVKGHNKQIMSLVGKEATLYAADGSGKVCVWNADTGNCEEVTGNGHSAQVNNLFLSGDTLVSCSVDDTVKFIDTNSKSFTDVTVNMNSQPQAVAVVTDVTVVVCAKEICVLQNGRLIFTLPVSYQPSCVSIHPNLSEVAVGGVQDQTVHIFSLSGGTLQETKKLVQTGAITCVAYSPDGAYLAAGDSNRKLVLYGCPDYQTVVGDEWTAHQAKIVSVAWSPNSQFIATGGLDTNIFIWNVNDKNKRIKIERAHKQSVVAGIYWRSNNLLASAGHDCIIKQWAVMHN